MACGLIPPDQLGEAEQLAREREKAGDRELWRMMGVASPLPWTAAVFYTMGGCWNLALAVAVKTSLSIELYYNRGHPSHAYVVDGEYAIDARGRNELRRVRGGAERTRRVGADELLKVLEAELPNGAAVVNVVRRREWIEAATRAADVVLTDER